MKQITIRIDEETLNAIDNMAYKKGISRADYIRMAIAEKLERDKDG